VVEFDYKIQKRKRCQNASFERSIKHTWLLLEWYFLADKDVKFYRFGAWWTAYYS
jgi:hypothetical protein